MVFLGRGAWNRALRADVGRAMLGEGFGSTSSLPRIPPELCCRGDPRLHLISLTGFCWLHSPAQRSDGGDLLVKKWECLSVSRLVCWVALEALASEQLCGVSARVPSVCGVGGEGEGHCRETGVWELPKVLGKGVSASDITTVVWASR